jgi:hypothetical protein
VKDGGGFIEEDTENNPKWKIKLLITKLLF